MTRSYYFCSLLLIPLLFSACAQEKHEGDFNVHIPKQPSCQHDEDCPGKNNFCIQTTDNKQDKKYCKIISLLNDGESCTSDNECYSGTCLSLDDEHKACTKLGCSSAQDCAHFNDLTDNECLLSVDNKNYCVRICHEKEDCPKDLFCDFSEDKQTPGICRPYPKNNSPFPTDASNNVTCINIKKGELKMVDFTLPEGTKSYFINAYTVLHPNEDDFTPNYIKYEHNGLAFNTDRIIRKYEYLIEESLNHLQIGNLFVPMSPELERLVGGGSLRIGYNASVDDRFCYQIYTKTDLGSTIDVNVYLVGVPGVTAATAEHDPDFANLFKRVNEIYKQQDLHIGHIRYFDLPDQVVKKYHIFPLQDDEALGDLVSQSHDPGTTLDDKLSVNLFFVEAISDGNIYGVSAGIPGMPGIHGSYMSGIVLTSAFLRDTYTSSPGMLVRGSEFTGNIVAHEIGHYLGLLHTSEREEGHDPLPDTPTCSAKQVLSANYVHCPDINNMMFPFTEHRQPIILTKEQGNVMRLNPLAK